MSDEELSAALADCEKANGEHAITLFEITTAAGFLLFSRHPADVVLLEVGLGGRLDATNVIDNPLATVITPVSIDHTDFLGGSLEKIATEKAGILKRGAPAIVAAQPRDALAVIERQAARLKAPLKIAGEDWTATEERRAVWSTRTTTDCSTCRRRNSTAATSSRMPVWPSPRCARSPRSSLRLRLRAGVTKADWPARLQRLAQGKLAALTPPGSELWLDGGPQSRRRPRHCRRAR